MIVPGRYHGDPIRDSAKREVPHISGEQKSYHPHIMPFSKKPQYGKRVKTRSSKRMNVAPDLNNHLWSIDLFRSMIIKKKNQKFVIVIG